MDDNLLLRKIGVLLDWLVDFVEVEHKRSMRYMKLHPIDQFCRSSVIQKKFRQCGACLVQILSGLFIHSNFSHTVVYQVADAPYLCKLVQRTPFVCGVFNFGRKNNRGQLLSSRVLV